MKNPMLFLFLFATMIVPQSFAQNIDLYATTFNGTNFVPPLQFGQLDLQSGSFVSLTTIPQTEYHEAIRQSAAFDHENHNYLFVTRRLGFPDDFYFHRIDAQTKVTLSSSMLTKEEVVQYVEFDLRTRKLYGLREDKATSAVYVTQINKQTGKIIEEYEVPEPVNLRQYPNSIRLTQTVFDSQRGIYAFIGWDSTSTSRLYRIKASTGELISKAPISDRINEMEYDVTNDMLYGIRFDSLGRVELVEVDMFNDQHRYIKTLSQGRSSFSSGVSAFHQQSQTYVYLEKPTNQGYFHLSFYHMPQDSIYTQITDNRQRQIKLDNSTFVATHTWPPTTSIDILQTVDMRIFPNPVVDKLYIEANQMDDRIQSIRLLDMTGKSLIAKENLNLTNPELDVSGLPQGVYFLQIKAGNQVLQRQICIRSK